MRPLQQCEAQVRPGNIHLTQIGELIEAAAEVDFDHPRIPPHIVGCQHAPHAPAVQARAAEILPMQPCGGEVGTVPEGTGRLQFREIRPPKQRLLETAVFHPCPMQRGMVEACLLEPTLSSQPERSRSTPSRSPRRSPRKLRSPRAKLARRPDRSVGSASASGSDDQPFRTRHQVVHLRVDHLVESQMALRSVLHHRRHVKRPLPRRVSRTARRLGSENTLKPSAVESG